MQSPQSYGEYQRQQQLMHQQWMYHQHHQQQLAAAQYAQQLAAAQNSFCAPATRHGLHQWWGPSPTQTRQEQMLRPLPSPFPAMQQPSPQQPSPQQPSPPQQTPQQQTPQQQTPQPPPPPRRAAPSPFEGTSPAAAAGNEEQPRRQRNAGTTCDDEMDEDAQGDERGDAERERGDERGTGTGAAGGLDEEDEMRCDETRDIQTQTLATKKFPRMPARGAFLAPAGMKRYTVTGTERRYGSLLGRPALHLAGNPPNGT